MHGTMIRDNRWKLCDYPLAGEGELYDLENDPQEFDNLWKKPEFRKIRQRLQSALQQQVSAAEYSHVSPGGQTLPPAGFQVDNRFDKE